MTRTRFGLIAVAALIVPLAACSSEPDPALEAFCADGAAVFEESTAASSQDPAEFLATAEDLSQRFAAVDPPEAIADDWQQVADTTINMYDALKDVDTADSTAFAEAFTAYRETVDVDRNTEATTAVSDYISENCTD